MARCNQCGAENGAGVEICAYCGSALKSEKPSSIQDPNHYATKTKESDTLLIKLTEVNMVNMSGQLLKAPQGFCWTVLLFGFFVPLFRKDFKTAGAMFVLVTFSLFLFQGDEGGIMAVAYLINLYLAFKYNELFTKKLLKDGYRPADKNSEWTLKSNGLLNTEFA